MIAALRALWRLLRPARAMTVSRAWLAAQGQRDGRAGWDGPRWRTPRERAALADQDRRVVRLRERRRA